MKEKERKNERERERDREKEREIKGKPIYSLSFHLTRRKTVLNI